MIGRITWIYLRCSNWALRETSQDVNADPSKRQNRATCTILLQNCEVALLPVAFQFSVITVKVMTVLSKLGCLCKFLLHMEKI